MAAPAAAAAALLAATAIAVYVFYPGSDKPTPAGDLPPGSYSFKTLQRAVVKEVVESGFFPTYEPGTLARGGLFVADQPAELPDNPVGQQWHSKQVPAEAGIDGRQCVFLDIRGLPAAGGAAAAGGGGASSAELLEAIRAIPALVAAAVNPPDVESIMSDRDYERYARGLLFGKLVEHCGLEVARGTALDRRTLLGQQWDFRAPVRCAATRGDPRNVDGIFEAFLSEEGYIRPPNIPTRVITPTKAGGATEPISAEYLAVFEITSGPNWTRGQRPMLPRLEKRLRLSLERAKAKGYLAAEQTITDLIAVVGVASPHECSDSVCARMDVEVPEGELHPFVHLKAMMDVGRFVFIKVPKAGSPAASAAGGGGATGR